MTHPLRSASLALALLAGVGCASVPDMESRLRTLQFHPNMYVVQAGDTLESIAYRYRLSPAELASLNPGLSSRPVPGLRINVRPGTRLAAAVRGRTGGEGHAASGPATPYVPSPEPVRPAVPPAPRTVVVTPVERAPTPRPSLGDEALLAGTGRRAAEPETASLWPELPGGRPAPRDDRATGGYAAAEYPPRESAATGYPAPDGPAPDYPASGYPAPDYPAPDYPAPDRPAADHPREEIVPDDLDVALGPDPATEPEMRATFGAAPAADGWSWPVDGAVARGFAPERPNGQGVDIAGVPGQDVRAALGGTVVYSGRDLSGGGNLVILRHDDALMTTYSHADRLFVTEDDVVSAGDAIASLGWNEDRESVLRFEVRRDGEPLDPLGFLPPAR